MPQDARLHHIALLGGGHFVLALAGKFKSHTADALDLVSVIDLRINAALLAIAQINDLLGLTEINAAGQFAHDHDVEIFNDLALQRGGVSQSGIADGRTQIGEEGQILAQAQKARLGAHIIGNGIPFGAAHRAEQNSVSRHGQGHMLFADRLAMGIIGRAAHKAALEIEAGKPSLAHEGRNLLDFGHDFGANPVAGQKEDIVGRHGSLSA